MELAGAFSPYGFMMPLYAYSPQMTVMTSTMSNGNDMVSAKRS